MNIAAINFYHPFQKEAIEKIIQTKNIKQFYQFIYPNYALKTKKVNIKTYDLFSLYFPLHINIYYKDLNGKDKNDILRYIQSIGEETNIYQMMDRLAHPDSLNFKKTYKAATYISQYLPGKDIFNKYFVSFSCDEKILMLYSYITFWSDFFTKKNISYFLFQEAPSMPFDFVGYLVAKYYKIQTILPEQTPIPGKRVFITDIQLHANEIVERVKNININNTDEFKNKLDKYFRKELDRVFFLKEQRHLPDYMKSVKYEIKRNRPSVKILIKNISLDYIYAKIKKKTNLYDEFKIRKKYNSLTVKNPDLSVKYIYFPLHLQPEKTTHPLGGAYANQILALEFLSEQIPNDVSIYVKENPKQTSLYRNVYFYEYLSKLKNVIFVPITFDTFTLIDNCIATATITGTVTWEGLWRKKPAIVFGSTILKYCSGVFSINNKEEMIIVLKKILNDYNVDIKELMKFTLALQNITVNLPYYHAFKQSKEEWIQNFYDGYMSKIESR